MKQNLDNNTEKFVKWTKICTIMTIFIGSLSIFICLLNVLKAFTDIEEKAPFLYGKVFIWILLAIYVVLFTIEIIFFVKARKCKKQLEESGELDDEDDEETNE